MRITQHELRKFYRTPVYTCLMPLLHGVHRMYVLRFSHLA